MIAMLICTLLVGSLALLSAAYEGNSTLSYTINSAVTFANSNCATHSEWLCAEFVSRALNAGGEFAGVKDYGNYNGYNLKSVTSLHKALLNYGWAQIGGTASNCGEKGDVLIYNIDGDPNAHAVFALGSCKLDQHNPSRCGTSSNWGPNIVLRKK